MNAANLDDKLVVIYFWCGCSKDAKRKDEIEKLATEEKKDVVFLEVNTDCEEAVHYQAFFLCVSRETRFCPKAQNSIFSP